MISLRQLRYLSALADTLHFGEAARRCSVSQPALSMQIQELEASLGVVLVERQRGRVSLTPEGREISQRGTTILAAVRDLADYARHRRTALSGTLRLGVIPSIAPYLLPRALPELRATYPDLVLALHETRTALLLEELQDGRLDLVLLALPLEQGDIETMALIEDRFVLALPAAEADAGLAPRGTGDIAADRLLLLEEGHCLRDQALGVCRAVDAQKLASFGATSLSTLVQLVANGYGVTLLPRLALGVELKDSRVRALPLEAPEPARTLGLAWRRTSPRGEEFRALGALLAGVAARIDEEADRALEANQPATLESAPAGKA